MRGATLEVTSGVGSGAGFNPRAREGRDTIPDDRPRDNKGFNPRAREGRDPIRRLSGDRNSSFNPRAREGRDTAAVVLGNEYGVSIRAPVRGATLNRETTRLRVMFQSARP